MMGRGFYLGALIFLLPVFLGGCAAPLKPYGPGPHDPQAEKIVIEKSARRLTLYRGGKPWRIYQVALGQGGLEPKEREGDRRTPEGVYFIKNRNPESIYYRALRISYPGPDDLVRARRGGYKPGSHIMIHGLPRGKEWVGERHRLKDWTEGCIAVTNREIEEIWNSVADGTPVEIRS